MSTSCNPVLQPASKSAPELQPFPYVDVFAETRAGSASGAGGEVNVVDSRAEQSRREEAARLAGYREGEAKARAALEERVSQAREAARVAVDDFAKERAGYYQQVEVEVVQLALSMARKILHRESQVDPLLLAGMVRVALERIERGTKVVVRVNPELVSEFRNYFARQTEPQHLPEVLEDATLEAGRCVLQTTLGTVELGMELQLKEIERGLLDLMARRPPVGS